MRRSMMVAAAAAMLALGAGAGTASAQGVGIYIGPSAAYDDDYAYGYERPYRYGPRVYGYSSDDDDTIVRTSPSRRGGCGTYRYWDGDRCVDARVVPPDNR